MELFVEYLARFGHVIAGVVWIGMLYYFNFVQTEYFKEADGDARVDAFSKIGATRVVVVPLGRDADLPKWCYFARLQAFRPDP